MAKPFSVMQRWCCGVRMGGLSGLEWPLPGVFAGSVGKLNCKIKDLTPGVTALSWCTRKMLYFEYTRIMVDRIDILV